MPKKMLLILPLSGPLSESARAFRRGFMTALMRYQPEVSVEVVDSHQLPAEQLKARIHAIKPDWVVGPMGRSDIQQYQQLRLDYPTLLLGEAEALRGPHMYYFSIASVGEISALIARLESLGLRDVVMINGASEWHRDWASHVKRLHPQVSSYEASEMSAWLAALQSRIMRHPQGERGQRVLDALLVNASAAEWLRIQAQLKEAQIKVNTVWMPSPSARDARAWGVEYADARLMLKLGDSYLSPSWLELEKWQVSHASDKYQRLVAWGVDACLMLLWGGEDFSAFRRIPFEGASGMSYVQDHQVIRVLDVHNPQGVGQR